MKTLIFRSHDPVSINRISNVMEMVKKLHFPAMLQFKNDDIILIVEESHVKAMVDEMASRGFNSYKESDSLIRVAERYTLVDSKNAVLLGVAQISVCNLAAKPSKLWAVKEYDSLLVKSLLFKKIGEHGTLIEISLSAIAVNLKIALQSMGFKIAEV